MVTVLFSEQGENRTQIRCRVKQPGKFPAYLNFKPFYIESDIVTSMNKLSSLLYLATNLSIP